MNEEKITKIVVFIDNRNTEEKTVNFAKAFVTTSNGKMSVLVDSKDINSTLREFQKQQDGKSLRELEDNKMIEAVNKYKLKRGEWVLSRTAQDKEEALEDAVRIANSELKKDNPYNGKKPSGAKKLLKKILVIAGITAGVAAAVHGCKKINDKDVKVVSEDENSLDHELTDREILEKDFDYYSDNYDYSVQMEVAYTANAFLEQANTKFQALGLKTEDGKDIKGLFTEEEAWVYAITIHNLGADDIVKIYQDSNFDYAKFEDTKQMLVTKMMQYQMLVSFGKLEQLDFTSEFMMPHDEFAKEVFVKIATDIDEVGKSVGNQEEAKTKLMVLRDDLQNYANSGNLSQNLQDILQVMYSPAYFSGVLAEYSTYGTNEYFSESLGEELVGKGLCREVKDQEVIQEIRSQHDNAFADSAAVLEVVQNINKKDNEQALENKDGYIYFMNEALTTLANEASNENKYKYSNITVDNVYDVHKKAEELVQNYLVSEKNLEVGTKNYNEEFNNIVTDKQDGVLSVETVLALISDNALIKGYSADIEGYSLSELQYQISVSINEAITDSMKEIIGIEKSGSTELPDSVKSQVVLSRDEAAQKFGEQTVQEAEKDAFDNEESKNNAEEKAEQVEKEAQDNFDKGNYEDLKDNAGKNDPENKDKYEQNVDQAIKDKEESDKIVEQGPSGEVNIDKDLEDLIEKGDGFVEVEQGKTPEGDVFEGDPGKIEWSDGETLGGNADKVVVENVVDPTANGQTQPETNPEINNNNGSISGGDTSYDIPEGWFEPLSVASLDAEGNVYATMAQESEVESNNVVQQVSNVTEVAEEETYTGSVIGGDIVYDIPVDLVEFYTTEDGYEAADITGLLNIIENTDYPDTVENGYSYQKTM